MRLQVELFRPSTWWRKFYKATWD